MYRFINNKKSNNNKHKKTSKIMKTKMIITSVAIAISINGLMANQSESILTFFNASGEELVQPMMMEETAETLPREVRCEFERLQNNRIYETFNINEMMRPEEEEELPYFIKEILQS